MQALKPFKIDDATRESTLEFQQHSGSSQAGHQDRIPKDIQSSITPKSIEKDEVTVKVGEADSLQFPEGGKGWLVIIGCVFNSFSTFGMINSFGVYQSYYETVMFPEVRSFKISIIGACQASIIYFLFPFVAPLIHSLGLRTTLLIGASFMITGLFGLSTTSEGQIWKCYLFQAIFFSIGSGFLFPPVCFSPMEWFKRKRAVALGISMCGVGLGGMVWPLIFKHMIYKVGFHWTVRTIAFIYIPLMCGAVIFIPQKLEQQYLHKRDTVSNSKFSKDKIRQLPHTYRLILLNWIPLLKNKTYMALLAVNLIGMLSSYPAIFYLDLFATTIAPNAKLTSYVVMIYSIAGSPGRVIPALVADKCGRVNILSLCLLLSGVFILCMWIPAVKMELLNLFAVFGFLYGFFIGPLFSLFPACLGQIFGIKGSEARLGMFFLTSTPGPIIGSLIAGSFIPVAHKGDKELLLDAFTKLCLYSGIMLVCSSIGLFSIRLTISRKLFVFV